MSYNARNHEIAVKIVTVILFFVGLTYVFCARELLKGRVPDIHRFIICVVFIYGSLRISQDFPLFLYKAFFKGKIIK